MRQRPVVRSGPGVPVADLSVHAVIVPGGVLPGQSVHHHPIVEQLRLERAGVPRLRRLCLHWRSMRDVDVQLDLVCERLLHRHQLRDEPDQHRVRLAGKGLRVVWPGHL